MLRGGSWSNVATRTRCAYRSYNRPDNGDVNWGFRLARLFS
jgi:formylglycine-generating enzyme required for sulfatase activity